MKKISPSPNTGIFSSREQIKIRANYLTKADNSLNRLDELRRGVSPKINIQRIQGGLGDVLMTLPTVRAISKKYNTTVSYTTDFEYLDGVLPDALRYLPYISEIIPHTETKKQFDAIINLTCPCIAHEKPGAPPINRIDLFARHAGIELDNRQIDYVISVDEKKEAVELVKSLQLRDYKLIIVNPSSSTSRRDLPYNTMASIVRELGNQYTKTRFVVLTHGTDGINSQQIGWNYLPRTTVIRDMKIRNIAALISLSDLVLCPDSALLHLSGALHRPSISFFGPTDPRARVNYYPESVAIWGAHGLKCRNCWYETFNCGMACWKNIEVPVTVRTAIGILSGTGIPSHPSIVSFPVNQITSCEII